MTDEDLPFEEIADEQDREPGRSSGHGRRRAPRSGGGGLRRALPLVLVLLVVAGLGYGGVQGYQWISANISVQGEPTDYEGPGHGEVVVEVQQGDTGTDIAGTLVDEGVILSSGPFISLFSNHPDAAGIEPGAYTLQQEMPAADALDALLDPANLASARVIVPEGKRLSEIWAILSEATGMPVEDFEAAAEDYTSYGVPENEAGSLEGYLLPGRYDIREEDTAEDVIAMMWERMEARLTELEIPQDQWHRTLTIASLAEMEVRDAEDYGKVVRVILNRLEGAGEAGGAPMKLQFDSTVHYASGKSGNVATSDAERSTDSPYNTYRYAGLPPGPIAAPGAEALEATLSPPEGDWLYFVSVNTDTGETKFAATWAEHEENVAEWQEWAADQ